MKKTCTKLYKKKYKIAKLYKKNIYIKINPKGMLG